ncbi:hypothetical protein SETIT_4G197300v2 [Setaria italica]|uniref:Uncharacterized protein n=1 Tax=Setaria italica TaxID=4555 RepID=A0A368QXX0_SETIT|nr:hypothetical protein SETIT_4G197300v2 [Setaria italica]
MVERIHQWWLRSRIARPCPRPEPAANPDPTVPNPNPRRTALSTRPRACNTTRRDGAGRGVAPTRPGSEAGHRSGTRLAPTTAPFLIATVFSPRAAGFGVAITAAATLERSPRMRHHRRRLHAAASHLN